MKPTNIRDELSLSTDENRAAYARFILNADTVINFVQSLADDDEHDLEYYQRLARSIMNTLQIAYRDMGLEVVKRYECTTDAGTYWMQNPMSRKGTAMLVPGQYGFPPIS